MVYAMAGRNVNIFISFYEVFSQECCGPYYIQYSVYCAATEKRNKNQCLTCIKYIYLFCLVLPSVSKAIIFTFRYDHCCDVFLGGLFLKINV